MLLYSSLIFVCTTVLFLDLLDCCDGVIVCGIYCVVYSIIPSTNNNNINNVDTKSIGNNTSTYTVDSIRNNTTNGIQRNKNNNINNIITNKEHDNATSASSTTA